MPKSNVTSCVWSRGWHFATWGRSSRTTQVACRYTHVICGAAGIWSNVFFKRGDPSIARLHCGPRRETHVKLRHARVDLKRGTGQNAFIGRRHICIDYSGKGQISPDIITMHAATQIQYLVARATREARSFFDALVGNEIKSRWCTLSNEKNENKDFFLYPPWGSRASYMFCRPFCRVTFIICTIHSRNLPLHKQSGEKNRR